MSFRAAFEAGDVDRRLAFYAPHAEWIEYRHTTPPRSPHVMRGHEEIKHFLHGVIAAPITMAITNEVMDHRRAAFTLTIRFDDGRRVIENIILEHRDGKVVRQIDVEAWD